MKLATLSQLFSLRDIRNAALGLLVVFGGIGLSALTYWAHLTGNTRLAGISAGVSLVFVLLILIFVVPPLARNASKEVSQLNLPFEFTAGGAVMLGLLMIVGFSAWNSGNNLLFLVLSFLAAAMVIGFFAGSICLKKLEVKMRFPETIFAGQETPILVSILNRKRFFSSYSVVAEVRGRERERSAIAEDLKKILPERLAERFSRAPIVRRTLSYFVHVPRNASIENKGVHIFPHRGHLVIKDFELSTRFPFGFFRHRRRLAARETELVVFPGLEPLGPEIDTVALDAGKLVANKRGSGQDLLAMRDYQPNDDLRRIDWKATARSRNLMVREFAAEDERKVTIFFDTRMPAGDEPKLTLREKIDAENSGQGVVPLPRFEEAVSRAAALAAHFCNTEADVRLVTATEIGEFGTGSRHLHEALRRLAVIEPDFQNDPADLAVPDMDEIFTDTPESHNLLITATFDESLMLPPGTQVIRY
ncbi:MAG TPA: DUF58 domain-containing protein [Pyrinomonadaceae bacterium]|nr:DUF58 domain-containing protein [Pyrinomonadaceae bacterium]